MKKAHNFLFFTLFLLSFLCSGDIQAQKQGKTKKIVIQTHFYCDHCKKCETCGQKFEAELYNTRGIKAYEIDEKKMQITVVYNPEKVNPEQIRQAISAIGYDADEVKANPVAYESLDACCKK